MTRSTALLVLILSFIATAGYAVKLAAKCPKVPDPISAKQLSELVFNDSPLRRLRLIVGVPFSTGHTSHLFKEINFNNRNWLKLKFDLNLIVFYTASLANNIAMRLFYGEFGGKFSYETTIHPNISSYKRVKCHKPIIEFGNMWWEDDFLIMWSCTEGIASANEHDEAVLVIELIDKELDLGYDESKDTYLKRLLDLNVTLRGFLKEPLLNEIDWAPEQRNSSVVFENPWPCPVSPTKNAFSKLHAPIISYVLCLFIITLAYVVCVEI